MSGRHVQAPTIMAATAGTGALISAALAYWLVGRHISGVLVAGPGPVGEEGNGGDPKFYEGFWTELWGAWRPLHALGESPWSSTVVLVFAVGVLWAWRRGDALHERSSILWLSGSLLPLVAAALLFTIQTVDFVSMLRSSGLNNSLILGSGIGEAAVVLVFATEVAILLALLWCSGRVGFLETFLRSREREGLGGGSPSSDR